MIRQVGRSVLLEPEEDSPPLGLAGLGLPGPKPLRVPFTQGDQMLLYTDGVIEARDGGGAFYLLTDRLALLGQADPQKAVDDLRADLVDHVGGPLPDDAAMLLVRR